MSATITSRATRLGTITVALTASLLIPSDARAQAARAPGPADWIADADSMLTLVRRFHPRPYRRIDRATFDRDASALRVALRRPQPGATRAALMMRFIARLEDGHTNLFPTGAGADFRHWVPWRVYWFADGLAVTAADGAYAPLLGARVLRIGREEAETAARAVAALQGNDNAFAMREHIQYLSSLEALRATRVTDALDALAVTLRLRSGRDTTVTLRATVDSMLDTDWMYHGEMFGTPHGVLRSVFNGHVGRDIRGDFADLPLHARGRIPFFHAWLPDSRTFYMKSEFVQDWKGERFETLYRRAFAALDTLPVARVIVDARYNSGGDGSRLIPFVHEYVRRPALDQPGRLFVFTGRKTFSAGVMLVDLMRKHTQATIVGEPMGAAYNHAGDATEIVLPRTGLTLHLSTVFHQLGRSDDTVHAERVNRPAMMTIADYVEGRDPLLEAALSPDVGATLPQLVRDQGAAALERAYAPLAATYGALPWWAPFAESAMNDTGYSLLRAGRVADAVAAFRLNARIYPGSWNAWDSFGEGLLALADTVAARDAYARSLALNPLNAGARAALLATAVRTPRRASSPRR